MSTDEKNAPETGALPLKPEPIPLFNAVLTDIAQNTEKKVAAIVKAEKTFEQLAKEKNYAPLDPDALIIFKISLLSFLAVVVMIWSKFLTDSVIEGVFVWNIRLFMDTVYMTSLNFTQVVIGRVVRYLQEQAKKAGIIE
jgi:hypothetical protein